jgi:class 3 adenylate cyclase
MPPPKTHYAQCGDLSIAYQVLGEGPMDLVAVWGWISHLDFQWMSPTITSFHTRLASFSRLIMFDKRGCGLSDPVSSVPTFEERMDDIRAVMDAVGSERAALLGFSEGAPMAALFAATYPERTTHLILYDGVFVGADVEGAPVELTWGEQADRVRATIDSWGDGETMKWIAPSLGDSGLQKRFWGMFERAAMTPGVARALYESIQRLDVRSVLPTIAVPTLVMHHVGSLVPVGGGKLTAELIPGARYIELAGRDHLPGAGNPEAIAGHVEEFVTGTRRDRARSDRILATVLFTDIVESTRRVAELGDSAWRELRERHDELVRTHLDRFGGREVKQTGDGFLASFDGPARAIRCADSIADEVRELGIEIRAGLHTGECELIGDNDLGGVAVHVAARVGDLAQPGEVLVSGTVKDLIMGSDIELADRGTHTLKGVPGEWRLFSVTAGQAEARLPVDQTERLGIGDRMVRRLARSAPGLVRLAVRTQERRLGS